MIAYTVLCCATYTLLWNQIAFLTVDIIIMYMYTIYIVRIIESSDVPLRGILNQREIAFITFSTAMFMALPSHWPANIFLCHIPVSHAHMHERTQTHILLYIIYPVAIIMSSSNNSIKMIVHWPSEMNCCCFFFITRKWYPSSPLPTTFASVGFFPLPLCFFSYHFKRAKFA